MELLLFVLICYGASNIMVFSSLFMKWRLFFKRISPKFFGEMFECMICLPFWWGVLLSLFIVSPAMAYLGISNLIIGPFIDGCIASGSVWLIHTAQESIEKNSYGAKY